MAATSPEALVAHVLRRCAIAPDPKRVACFTSRASTPQVAATAAIEWALQPAPLPISPAQSRQDGWDDALKGWAGILRSSGAGLHERTTWFWHNHFVTSSDKIGNQAMLHRQRQLLRTRVRQLRHASPKPAMRTNRALASPDHGVASFPGVLPRMSTKPEPRPWTVVTRREFPALLGPTTTAAALPVVRGLDGPAAEVAKRGDESRVDGEAEDDRSSVAAGLAPLASRLAFVEGVGVSKPDFLPHRDDDAMVAGRRRRIGVESHRLPRALLRPARHRFPVVGVSVGGGSVPTLLSAKASTVVLPGLDSLCELTNDRHDRMRATMSSLTDGAGESAGLDSVDSDLLARGPDFPPG